MRSTSHLVIGVDGGGSGCRAAVAGPDGPILGQGAAGPANATTDPAESVRNVLQAIREAAEAAGVGAADIAAAEAHVGLAGVMSAEDARLVARGLALPRATVTDDRPTFLSGALGRRDGVLLAIGTGSFAAASRQGRQRFAGGWGFQVSDQASGAWLGRGLLERVLLAVDGIEAPGALTREVLAEFGGDPNRIVLFARDARPPDYARFAPRIAEAAGTGDAAAAGLMRDGAAYLVRVIDTLGLGAGEALCLAGGIGPLYRDWLPEALRGRVAAPAGSALDGAVALARDAALRRAG